MEFFIYSGCYGFKGWTNVSFEVIVLIQGFNIKR